MTTASDRIAMAKAIVDFEARRDKSGHLVVYRLPANDGGGEYEVAGINQKYDREACDALCGMVNAGRYTEAETYADEYIAKNTDPAARMTSVPMIESYLRDCVFNRGTRGATRILQRALGVSDDGEIGPVTRAAMQAAEKDPDELLQSLRDAREDYERHVVGYRANLWNGLVNRWNKSMEVARRFPKAATAAQGGAPEAPGDGAPNIKVAPPIALVPPAAPPNAGIPQAMPSPPWYEKAATYLGFHERPGNRGIEEFISLAHCGELGDPWCAIFVNACLEAVGVRGTRSAMARSFEHHPEFVKLPGPAIGCVVTMWRGSKSAGTGHVFFYSGENDHGILALGGNQSDEVCKQYEPRDRIVGYFWPKSVRLPATGRIVVKDSARTGGSEV